MIDQMRAHIVAKFEEAQLNTSPCPHLVIEGFFPDEVYEKLLAYNPFKNNRGVEWMHKRETKRWSSRTPYHARKQVNFHSDQEFDSPEEQQAFWRDFKNAFLVGDWFPQLVIDKFPMYFDLRFGDATDRSDFVSLFRRELFLQRHEPGFRIGPHTDIPTRVFTCIFSFAEREGFEQFGTEFLAPKNPMARCWGNDHHSPDDFELKTLAPYKPNNFLLFFKTRHSFHSVPAITEDVPNQRYGMQFQFYEPTGGLFSDLSAPDIMKVIQVNRGQKTPLRARLKSALGR